MSIQVWRRAAKCAAFLDVIFSASILLTIIGLAAVEVADSRTEKKQETATAETNATDVNPDKTKPTKIVNFWKMWAGSMTLFLVTALQIWSSGRLFKGASSVLPLEGIRRTAIVWIIVKLLLVIIGIPIKVVIFHAYIVTGIAIMVHLLLILVVGKYVKELKVVIKSG